MEENLVLWAKSETIGSAEKGSFRFVRAINFTPLGSSQSRVLCARIL